MIFYVLCPADPYNPDWALALEENSKDKLYFIVETKGSIAAEDLRPTELAKIRCGEKYFAAIQTGITLKKQQNYKKFIKGCNKWLRLNMK